jgi:hypothetical protein
MAMTSRKIAEAVVKRGGGGKVGPRERPNRSGNVWHVGSSWHDKPIPNDTTSAKPVDPKINVFTRGVGSSTQGTRNVTQGVKKGKRMMFNPNARLDPSQVEDRRNGKQGPAYNDWAAQTKPEPRYGG